MSRRMSDSSSATTTRRGVDAGDPVACSCSVTIESYGMVVRGRAAGRCGGMADATTQNGCPKGRVGSSPTTGTNTRGRPVRGGPSFVQAFGRRRGAAGDGWRVIPTRAAGGERSGSCRDHAVADVARRDFDGCGSEDGHGRSASPQCLQGRDVIAILEGAASRLDTGGARCAGSDRHRAASDRTQRRSAVRADAAAS